MPKRIYLELVAIWGNGDADARIKVSRRKWKNIQEGASYETTSYSYYEGRGSVVDLLPLSGHKVKDKLIP